ncbi:MAG TPA: carboxypeptidase regulatory-like domain-containing protein [Xanthomonadaceae bacterium]|nr:carboxypeptidase regulatory-like domain-containing protein [Xanthomonadaceae bacterium]
MRATVRWTCPSALSLGLCVLAACLPAGAADLVVRVGDRGTAVSDAVVSLVQADGASRGAASAVPPTAAIDQRDLAFLPYVQVARPGGAAVFRNSDHTRHHVYSFSPAATFEMVLGPGERSGRVPLQEEGVVAVGCNIHDQMIAWLYVSDAPWLARTGQGGGVRFRDVPPGDYRVRVWHPRLDARGDAVERRVTLHDAASRSLDIAVRLRPDARAQPDRERADY